MGITLEQWGKAQSPRPHAPVKLGARAAFAAGLTVGTVFGHAWGSGFEPREADHVGGVPTASVQEDDPNWDCRTMGNKVCGPFVVRVTGNASNGFKVHWSTSKVDHYVTNTEWAAECQEATNRTACNTERRTTMKWLKNMKRALRAARNS
jgi:hypothetical protein